MANDYRPRRNTAMAGRSPQRGDYPQRQPPRRNRRKIGPPPLFYLVPALILLIVVVVVIVVLANGRKKTGDTPAPASSQLSSQASSFTSSGTSSLASAVSAASSTPTASVTPPPEQVPSGDASDKGPFLQIGDTGFGYYHFDVDATNQYITTISGVGNELAGAATVYDLVIPSSMDVMLPESYLNENGIDSSDQRKAIEEYIYPSINGMSPSVKTVSLFDALKLHTDEYLYFRSEQSWTQLGAYYAYAEFCKAKGIEAVSLDQFEKKSYEGFLGSYYREYPDETMGSNPDTMEAYVPENNPDISYTTTGGETLEQAMIMDGSGYSSQWLYLIFCAGDQPYKVITNDDLPDGPSCVVVMESSGNVFLPFLVNHYHTVYAVDYRTYQGNIASLVREKGAEDLIFLNDIFTTSSGNLTSSLDNSF